MLILDRTLAVHSYLEYRRLNGIEGRLPIAPFKAEPGLFTNREQHEVYTRCPKLNAYFTLHGLRSCYLPFAIKRLEPGLRFLMIDHDLWTCPVNRSGKNTYTINPEFTPQYFLARL